MDRARTRTGMLAWGVTAALVLTGCIASGEVVAPDPTSTSPTRPSATPTEPAAPVVGLAVLADDPAALVVATLRARAEGGSLRVVAGVPSPADRDAWRSLDALTVLASDDRSGARLARSAGQTVEVTEVVVGNLAEELATNVTTALAAQPDFSGTVHVALTTEAATLADEVTALAAGDLLLAVDGDVRAAGPANVALRAALEAGVDVALLGDVDAAWQLDVVRAGLEVPGGGQLLRGRRYIAAYGTPGTPSLGVLGEQGVEAAHARILQIAEPYDDGTMPIVPVFEIIAAVASASATADGDYSYGISFDLIREWVDYAAANDILVVLDIQPGRTDFLTHAKQYEEFLVQPHVGLALDPEWRLKPNQVHLRQIGTVDGAEINQVVDWLAALVREHNLPQKMLVMHQFRHSMITNRDLVASPDELMVVLHMDGQGGQPAKDASYDALIAEGQPWAPGWKNFYDEDRPMAGADRVLALTPQPVFISFQ